MLVPDFPSAAGAAGFARREGPAKGVGWTVAWCRSIAELPNNAAAAAVAATVGSSGALTAFETVALMAPEEIDAAVKLSPVYRPPGR